jgi:hypothetical protein
MDTAVLNQLRSAQMLETTKTGDEAVRFSATFQIDLAKVGRAGLRPALETQCKDLSALIAPLGGEVIPGSLVPIGQMAELLLPVKNVTELEKKITTSGVRLDVVQNRDMTM